MHAESGEGAEWRGPWRDGRGVTGSLEEGRPPGACLAWLLQEEYHGEDLAPTRLLWLLMVKRWPGAWMEVGRAIREGTTITLGPPHHLLFLSSPVCFPLGIISDKNPTPPDPAAEAKQGLFYTGSHACPCWSHALQTALRIPSSPAQMYPSLPPPVVPGRCSIPPR